MSSNVLQVNRRKCEDGQSIQTKLIIPSLIITVLGNERKTSKQEKL